MILVSRFPTVAPINGGLMGKESLRINGRRLRQSLETMAQIGATPNGGVQRLTLTDEDKRLAIFLSNGSKS